MARDDAAESLAKAREIIENGDFSAGEDRAIVWSGAGNRQAAEVFAQFDIAAKGTTRDAWCRIEDTPGGKDLRELIPYEQREQLGISPDEYAQLWEAASERYALSQQGDVKTFVQGAREEGAFRRIEQENLMWDEKVTSINGLDKQYIPGQEYKQAGFEVICDSEREQREALKEYESLTQRHDEHQQYLAEQEAEELREDPDRVAESSYWDEQEELREKERLELGETGRTAAAERAQAAQEAEDAQALQNEAIQGAAAQEAAVEAQALEDAQIAAYEQQQADAAAEVQAAHDAQIAAANEQAGQDQIPYQSADELLAAHNQSFETPVMTYDEASASIDQANEAVQSAEISNEGGNSNDGGRDMG